MALFTLLGLGATALAGTATAIGATAATAATAATGAGVATALGTAATLAGTATSYIGQRQAAKASQEAEALRKRQMRVEAANKRRNIIREALIARGQSVNQAAAAGVGLDGGSSVLAGIGGSTIGTAASNIGGINVGQTIGEGIFDANADVSRAQGITAIGQGLSGVGNTLLQNNVALGKMFASESPSLRTQPSVWTTTSSRGI